MYDCFSMSLTPDIHLIFGIAFGLNKMTLLKKIRLFFCLIHGIRVIDGEMSAPGMIVIITPQAATELIF